MPSYKRERLEKILEREISNIIFTEVKNEKLKFVTITNVNLTGDLSLATVFYTILGDTEEQKATEADLLDSKGFIKGILGKRLEVKKIPDLKFKYDESYEQGNRIDNILKNLGKKE